MELQHFQSVKNAFLQELISAHNGKKTSLPYIIHHTSATPLVSQGEIFQVIVIGGTFAIQAFLQKEESSCKILSQKKITMPLMPNKEDFFIFIEKLIDSNIKILSLNFAYPLLPVLSNNRLDGILLRGTKGHMFRGLVGKAVGEEIEKYIKEKNGHNITVSVANDTVCLLLSGLEKTSWEKLGAGIVGTGMNFAFYLKEDKLVNLESADFDKITQSITGKEIDLESANPGKSTYEKEVAGVYLYKHYNKILRKKHLLAPSISSTQELDAIAKSNSKTSTIAKFLLSNSACLIAAQIAAIMEFRKTDMVFIMEGSLFWKGYNYKETVKKTVADITEYKPRFIEIENSGIIGAAHLVM